MRCIIAIAGGADILAAYAEGYNTKNGTDVEPALQRIPNYGSRTRKIICGGTTFEPKVVPPHPSLKTRRRNGDFAGGSF